MCLASLSLSAQISYSDVVSVDSSLTKDELFIRAQTWVFETFKNPGNVIQMSDKNAGLIAGSGSMLFTTKIGLGNPSGWISFNFKISVKQGKYKYEFSNFVHSCKYPAWTVGTVTDDPPKMGFKKLVQEIKDTISLNISEMLKSLNSDMITNSKNDW